MYTVASVNASSLRLIGGHGLFPRVCLVSYVPPAYAQRANASLIWERACSVMFPHVEITHCARWAKFPALLLTHFLSKGRKALIHLSCYLSSVVST